jgi:uncharacterized protein
MRERIAIIGSGMAGLAAAWYLGEQHEVTVFEKHARTGIAAHGVDAGAGRIDVPLRVIYPGYYPQLFALLQEAGVAVEGVDASLSFTDTNGRCYFRYANVGVGQATLPLISPLALLSRTSRHILADLGRFMVQVPTELQQGNLQGKSIGTYLAASGYSPAFIDQFLVPCFAGINTVSNQSVSDTPAEVIAAYFSRGFLFSKVFRAVGGASAIAAALTPRIAHTYFDAQIRAIRRNENGVVIHCKNGEETHFDRVIFATQANQIVSLLADATRAEKAVLGGISYGKVEVVMHHDKRLAPRRRANWSPVNYLLSDAHDRPMVTIWINALLPTHRAASQPVFQTINPHIEPDPEQVLQRTVLERPVVDLRSSAILTRLDALHAQKNRRVFFCGSYAANGIPLLESATASAHAVAQRIERASNGHSRLNRRLTSADLASARRERNSSHQHSKSPDRF